MVSLLHRFEANEKHTNTSSCLGQIFWSNQDKLRSDKVASANALYVCATEDVQMNCVVGESNFKSYSLLSHLFYFILYRAEYDLFQIELSKNYGLADWRDDIKRVLMKAGLENNPVVFLFSDTQVIRILIYT